jgi:hypothetical protein
MEKNSFILIFFVFIGCSVNEDFDFSKLDLKSWEDHTLVQVKNYSNEDSLLLRDYNNPIHVNYGDNIVFHNLKEDIINKLQRRGQLLKTIIDSAIVFNTNELYINEFHTGSHSYFYILNFVNKEYVIFDYDEYYDQIEEFKYNIELKNNTERSFIDFQNAINLYVPDSVTYNIIGKGNLKFMEITSKLKFIEDKLYYETIFIVVDAT